ncbi:hypothetical protein P162_0024 [Bacteriophage T5-like cott162]|nr:hypothetical protein HOS37_gp023 [Escherichia phage saus132]ASU02388.1 hypothetical protein P1301_0025 [Bacteriophage T5-like chee130_1]ASU02694.1 hypothetical protein P149_0023 [Bacteriophage T5-like poul149]ASU02849.1 hypothetical protein P158_0025 [Bacteriophage T5-like chee158]ASU03003.1 hypothetical protein P162_0024 [Bacteriophage T5-like cott162]ASU03157.1 hypothetical protein P176N_0025 [Bacteriophage T5-like saus176N]
MLSQRDADLPKPVTKEVYVYTSPEVQAIAERNRVLAEANVALKQTELDEALSKYSGVEVVDAYKMEDSIEVKLQIEEGKRFCKMNDSSLVKIKFYETISPYIKCSNGVTD